MSRRTRLARKAADSVSRFEAAVRDQLAGRTSEALAQYLDIVATTPAHAGAHNNAGSLLAQRGELTRALALFRRAVALQPDDHQAQHNLGLALTQTGLHEEAIGHLTRAVELAPTNASWWSDLANALVQCQRYADAVPLYERSLALAPGQPVILANFAVALRGLRRYDDAVTVSHAALAQEPNFYDALCNLGNIQKERRHPAEAFDALSRAIALEPTLPAARVNLASLEIAENRLEEARAIIEAVVTEHPSHAPAWSVLGHCAFEEGNYAEAEDAWLRARDLDPTDASAEFNLANLWLLHGDFARGLPAYEARIRVTTTPFGRRFYEQPDWNGEPLEGRRILLHAEQGVGDTFQNVRFAKQVKERGAGRVILECPSSIAELMRSVEGVDEVVIEEAAQLPPFDVQAYLCSLPFLVGTTLETIPKQPRYLSAPTGMRFEQIAPKRTPTERRIGIVWSGNPMQPRNPMRAIGIRDLAPLFELPDTQFYSLQKGASVVELASLAESANVVNLDSFLRTFSDTAAAIEELDLVITVCTSVAHLAASLGKPTWLLLSKIPDQRWLLDREDSPWYPTIRLFRQRTRGDWSSVVERLSDELRSWQPPPSDHIRPDSTRTLEATASTSRSLPLPVPEFIEIDWEVGLGSGWGTYGMHLALSLEDFGQAKPVLLYPPTITTQSSAGKRLAAMPRQVPPGRHTVARLIGLGNGLIGATPTTPRPGTRIVGVVFFEDTAIDADVIARSKAFDLIIAGSSFNGELLKAYGIGPVAVVLQGVDLDVFHPAPRQGLFGDRLAIFSGGKLEYRKAQDIVIEAFRRVLAVDPDALLVTAWHNHWPATMVGVDASGYVKGLPDVRGGALETTEWLVRNGIPARNVLDLGLRPHAAIAEVVRECTVAVFPNRCEGGTNLVAMEAMAVGVPTVLSANSGHLNLIGAGTCFVLEEQADINRAPPGIRGTWGWGESDPAELSAKILEVSSDPTAASAVGSAGAALMTELSWNRQNRLLLDAISSLRW